MPETLDTRNLRQNVLDWLDAQELDAQERKAKSEEVQQMNHVELITLFPECTSD